MKLNTSDSRAFTLIETTLAIGITASVLLALVALLPTGLSALDKGNSKGAHARIVQTLAGEYRMLDWDALPDPTSPVLHYFDRRGLEVEQTSDELRWVARAEVRPGQTLPGDSAPNTYVRELVITMSGQFFEADPFAAGTPGLREFATLISKFDK